MSLLGHALCVVILHGTLLLVQKYLHVIFFTTIDSKVLSHLLFSFSKVQSLLTRNCCHLMLINKYVLLTIITLSFNQLDRVQH